MIMAYYPHKNKNGNESDDENIDLTVEEIESK